MYTRINEVNVSVIISIWNSELTLFQCLACLDSQTYKDFEIIIIDNGSTDETTEKLKKYSRPNIHLKQLETNAGFAAANNIGARLARGQWLAFLNADAFPQPDWLEQLLKAAQENPQFTSFSSRQIQANAPEFLDGAGDAYHVSGFAWRRYIGYPAKDYGHEPLELFSPCAAAAMYLRQAFLDVGGFDEDFFSYFEDVDLGFRLQLKGYRCLYVPGAVVHHIGSATFGESSDFAFYYSHRNLVWTFLKNMPSIMLWRYLPAHLMANLIYISYYTLRGRGKVLWRAKYDALKELPKFIRKRRKIQENTSTKDSDLMRVMQYGWLEPYFLGYHMRRARRTAGLSSSKN